MKRLWMAGASAVLAMVLGVGSAGAADKKVLAFVVNGASDFWKIAEAGNSGCWMTSSRPARPASW